MSPFKESLLATLYIGPITIDLSDIFPNRTIKFRSRKFNSQHYLEHVSVFKHFFISDFQALMGIDHDFWKINPALRLFSKSFLQSVLDIFYAKTINT